MTLSFLSLAQVSLAETCAALNAGYEGYIVPIGFDPAALARRIQAEHIDQVSSQLLRVDDKTAGIMLIARRGRTSRLAALGIATPLRGAGIGAQAVAAMIAAAQAHGDERIVLEVIDSNVKAIATYVKVGFSPHRTLVGYAHDPVQPSPMSGEALPCPVDHALPLLFDAWPDEPSWQTRRLALPAQHSRSRPSGPTMPPRWSMPADQQFACWRSLSDPGDKASAAASCRACWHGSRTARGRFRQPCRPGRQRNSSAPPAGSRPRCRSWKWFCPWDKAAPFPAT